MPGIEAPLAALAPAKVNLTLQVTGIRPDGYHLLASLVVFAGVGDRLTVAPAEVLSLRVNGPRAAGVPEDGTNLVLKAAERLRSLRGITAGAQIGLEKHLPHGGGIGGGSSDAATAIRLLADLWAVTPLTTEEALPLGADIPVCLAAPSPRMMRGIGEDLAPVPALPPGWLVLVNPGVARATPAVFRAFDAVQPPDPHPHPAPPAGLDLLELADWLRGHRNDLARVLNDPASAVHLPQIGAILTALGADESCLASAMSGSGSTCWGLYPTETAARAAAMRLGAAHPDWWCVAAEML